MHGIHVEMGLCTQAARLHNVPCTACSGNSAVALSCLCAVQVIVQLCLPNVDGHILHGAIRIHMHIAYFSCDFEGVMYRALAFATCPMQWPRALTTYQSSMVAE
jgi:hypothetical protein